jgi:positive regulator of sigma E activity
MNVSKDTIFLIVAYTLYIAQIAYLGYTEQIDVQAIVLESVMGISLILLREYKKKTNEDEEIIRKHSSINLTEYRMNEPVQDTNT